MSSLQKYKKKRDFSKTPEPKIQKSEAKTQKYIFVIQEHFSKRKHFDFRIQILSSLRSWAVPKGIPKNTKDKRLAILTENHPLEYAKFEGVIPKGEYGAGRVKIYDRGTFENIKKDKEGKIVAISKCFKNGQIEIFLHGKKINAAYALVRFRDDKTWLLIKMKKRKNDKKS
ncbi:MAG: hypothetical protein KR126chlam4_00590 [Candidatus Anoxychlamydiales bacterium]|uniref:DNA ligase D 3'-phosphoesterase domain-containing protein n=1 Tax=marine sediment metagenome TaxID=412755 RepID=A0A0F9EG96_9ZZZZ|nr:hypothetical protein [Candidatus Anoxychlamydiales bacterium]NGX40759.1 hypothetical protein [Candidatus Anoxychlamydiales bacterium]HEU64954.1 DNA ligase [Chlamydiota bacterium]